HENPLPAQPPQVKLAGVAFHRRDREMRNVAVLDDGRVLDLTGQCPHACSQDKPHLRREVGAGADKADSLGNLIAKFHVASVWESQWGNSMVLRGQPESGRKERRVTTTAPDVFAGGRFLP